MDVHDLADLPPWEWPSEAHDIVLRVLRDRQAPASDRLVAAELAGELIVMNDELGDVALSIISDRDESEELRGNVALALGPALEHADLTGYEDFDDVVLSKRMFEKVRKALHGVYADGSVPKSVRRRVLEAAVRAPEDWQKDAVRAAWASDDAEWKLTGVFGMGHLPGFEADILEALRSDDIEMQVEAVRAAGNRGVEEGWPVIKSVLDSRNPDKDLLLAAIEATPTVRLADANYVLAKFLESHDEDVVAVAEEALSMAQAISEDPYGSDDDADEEDEEEDR